MRFDESLAFKRDPYRFIAKRCRQIASDVYETRLFLRKTTCLTGRAAAQLFYDGTHFARHGAAPEPLQKTLLGVGGVQSLDGADHQHRKAMFLALMTPARVRELAELFRQELLAELPQWQSQEQVVLYDALQPVLTRAVCKWAGVPLAPREIARRSKQMTALFDAAGRFPAHFKSRLDRTRAEDWAAGQEFSCHVKGWLPYTLRFEGRVDEAVYGERFHVTVWGEASAGAEPSLRNLLEHVAKWRG